MVFRNGFTGELSYEIHFNSDKMEDVALELTEGGTEFNLEEISAPEVGMTGTVNLDKDFIGKKS